MLLLDDGDLKSSTQRLNIPTQCVKSVGVVATPLNTSHLRLRNAQSPAKLRLSQPGSLACLNKLQPEFLLCGLLLINGSRFGSSQQCVMPLLVCLFSFFNNVIVFLSHRVISPFPLFLQSREVAATLSQPRDEAFFQSSSESHTKKQYADLRKRSR